MKCSTVLLVAVAQLSVAQGAFEPKPRLVHLESTGIEVTMDATKVNTTETKTTEVNTTVAATAEPVQDSNMPSDSPAPSPSPSIAPTPVPSSTLGPTKNPSYAPSESPVPSPSPTSTPSATPTDFPSQLPSEVPSDYPTNVPSQSPSLIPSDFPSLSSVPSMTPTLSSAPSDVPTHSPSQVPSDMPSLVPSDLPSMSAAPSNTPTTGLPSLSPSDYPTMLPSSTPSSHAPSTIPSSLPSDMPSIYSTIKSAVLSVTLDLHDTLEPAVQEIWEQQTEEFIVTQFASDMPPMEGTSIDILSLKIVDQTAIPQRRSLREGRALHAAGLRIRFNVTGEIKPGNPPPGFMFANEIARPFRENYNMYIYRLHSVHEIFQDLVNRTDSNPDSLSGGNSSTRSQSAGFVAGIVIASIGSVVLAIFAGMYAIRSRRSDESIAAKPIFDVYHLEQVDSHSTMMTPYNEKDHLSPHSVESGIEVDASKHSRDSAKYRANPKSLLDDMISKNDSANDDGNSGDLGLKLTDAVLGAHGDSKNNYRAGSDPPAVEVVHGMAPHTGSLCYSDDDSCGSMMSTPTSVQLTPHSATQATTPSSVFSGPGNLGARPMYFTEQLKYQADNASVDSSIMDASSVKRTGLYDVFAPSGPLGIVVDTTKDGPVVHSMKPTSPLLGLVSAGDLIVGLDDMDTRSMTAATLTRLMAKRSHQAERKITLLAIESASSVNL